MSVAEFSTAIMIVAVAHLEFVWYQFLPSNYPIVGGAPLSSLRTSGERQESSVSLVGDATVAVGGDATAPLLANSEVMDRAGRSDITGTAQSLNCRWRRFHYG